MHNPARLLHRHGQAAFEGRRTDHYNRLANGLMAGVYRRPAADIAAAAPPQAELLDVGTGPGRLLVELARRRADLRLTGVDISAEMAAHARRNVAAFGERVTVLEADVASLPFPDDAFDVIVSSLSMHHWPDVAAGAAELARVLRPGGQLRIYDFRFAQLDQAAEVFRRRPEFRGRAAAVDRFRSGVLFGLHRLVI